jgi:hypothetical protein
MGSAQKRVPEVGHPTATGHNYHIRTGKHDPTLYDWERYMDFTNKHFGAAE